MTWLSCLNPKRTLKGQWLMMTVCKVPATLLHQIEQELDADEREAMLFLCRDLVPELPVSDIRKLWVALNERENLTLFTLSELLYRVRRFDLLKKLLKTERVAVEAGLVRYPQMVSNYRVLMTEISQDLDKEDLASLAFLLMDDLAMSYGKMTKEKVNQFFLVLVSRLGSLRGERLDKNINKGIRPGQKLHSKTEIGDQSQSGCSYGCYIIQGAVEVAYQSPLACWFSAMLYCFGGSVLSALMLAEPPVAFLANTTNVLLASSVWYLVFYCPHDLVYHFVSFLPIRLVVAAMKEVTRTWKITGGVAHAHSRYKNAWIVMIAVGWARGAGGGLISNFEQLVRGIWKPETNELLKMSCPVKTSLVGAVLFTMQHTLYLPIEKHNLMFLYTIFTVLKKVTMMLSGFTGSPFAPLENTLGCFLFGSEAASSNVTNEAKVPLLNDSSSSCDCVAGGEIGDSAKKKHAKKTE